MPVQTMGLDYSWLVNLADIISRARQEQPSGPKGATDKGGGFMERQRAEWKEEETFKREAKESEAQRAHEIVMKQMELDSTKDIGLAEAMSKERIAGMGAEAGTEQAQIGAAGQVAAAQKTTMEKGYEFVDMIMNMDEKSANELIAGLEKKDEEYKQQQGGGRPSTISSGGVTLPIGEDAEVAGDPNNPLRLLEEIGAYTPGGGAPRPKPTGAAKNEVEEFMGMVDDMIGGDIAGMAAMLSGEGGTEKLMEKIEVLGTEAGISKEVIDSVKEIYRAMTPPPKPPPEEGGGLAGIIQSMLNPTGAVETPETEAGAELWTGGAGRGLDTEAPLVEKTPGFAKTLEEFVETIVTGPFHPAYEKWKDKRTGKTVVKEPTATKEVGEITEQDVITEMSTWDKEKVKAFQTVAKEAGIYKGPINGLHSNELDSAMKEYFKSHRDEWGETE